MKPPRFDLFPTAGQYRLPRMHAMAALTLLALASSAWAVVVDSGDGSGNITAPNDDPGFANVGVRGVASAVYLGNRWVMTAAHVGPGSVTFGGIEYPFLSSETVRIGNPEDLSPETDILLLRLADTPDLPSLHLPCHPRRLGTELIMIGNGQDRAPDLTYWKVEAGPEANDDVWTEVTSESQSDRLGFKTLDSQSVRWGLGSVNNVELATETPNGDVLSFTSSFSKALQLPSVSQAVRGDSGGAVFEKNGGVWELTGMIYAVNPLENQPEGTRSAVYGETTLIADLFRYKDMLLQAADFEPAPVDLDGDGRWSADEIDALLAGQTLGPFASCHLDVDHNGTVNSLDVEAFFNSTQILVGDTNLDGNVGFADFLTLSRTFGSPTAGWANGDFDGDGQVSFSDFLRLSGNFGRQIETSSAADLGTSQTMEAAAAKHSTGSLHNRAVNAVPECVSPSWLLLMLLWRSRWQRRSR